MSDTTTTETPAAQSPVRKPAHPFVWLFLGVVMLICTGAAGAVYLEHRLAEYNTARDAMDDARLKQQTPSATTLRMLSTLQTRVKSLEAELASASSTLKEQQDALAQLNTQDNPNVEAIATLKTSTEQLTTDLAALKETVKEQAEPVNAYAEVLKSFLQLKQHIGTEKADADIAAFKNALDKISITPAQLPIRARIADHTGRIEAALTHRIPSQDVLASELHDAITALKPAPEPHEEKSTEEAPEDSSFWQRLSDFSRKHIRIEPEAVAKAREHYETLRRFEESDDFLGAARTISAMDQAPEALTKWHARAKHYLSVSRALSGIEADLTMLVEGA